MDGMTPIVSPPPAESRWRDLGRAGRLVTGLGIGAFIAARTFAASSRVIRATAFAAPTAVAAVAAYWLGQGIAFEDPYLWENHFKDVKWEEIEGTQISTWFPDPRQYPTIFVQEGKGFRVSNNSDKHEGAKEIIEGWKALGLTPDQIKQASHLCTMQLFQPGQDLAQKWYRTETIHIRPHMDRETSSIHIVWRDKVTAEQLMKVYQNEPTVTIGYLKETITIDVGSHKVKRHFTPLLRNPPSLTFPVSS